MATYDINRLMPFFTKEADSLNDLSKLVRDILILQQKLEHPEQRSEQFQMALESNQIKLQKLLGKYDHFKEIINNCAIQDFERKIEEDKKSLERILQMKDSITCKGLAYGATTARIKQYETLIKTKQKWGILKDFNDLTSEDIGRFFE